MASSPKTCGDRTNAIWRTCSRNSRRPNASTSTASHDGRDHGGGKDPDPTLVRREASETFGADAATEVKTSRLMMPYRALAMAVRNEERAFAF